MKRRERIIFLLFLIITLNKCIQPPNDDSLNQIIANKPELFSLYNNNDLSLKNQEKSDENAVIANSSVTITYYEDYQTLEHQIILVPQNLPENEIPYIYTFRIYTYYKYIIPEGYIFLGTKFSNIALTKVSETTYSYYGPCPKDLEVDIIRYSPENVSWKTNVTMSLVYPLKFTNDVIFLFPEVFYGGKYTNDDYIISGLDKDVIYIKKVTFNNSLFYQVGGPCSK